MPTFLLLLLVMLLFKADRLELLEKCRAAWRPSAPATAPTASVALTLLDDMLMLLVVLRSCVYMCVYVWVCVESPSVQLWLCVSILVVVVVVGADSAFFSLLGDVGIRSNSVPFHSIETKVSRCCRCPRCLSCRSQSLSLVSSQILFCLASVAPYGGR